MSHTCIKISGYACFLLFSGVLFLLSRNSGDFSQNRATLTFSRPEAQCDFYETDCTPSLESFIRASQAVEGNELRLNGLAVFSKLANACQPLADVSKAKIQVNKIALISLANSEAVCSSQDLLVHAQNAGYSVVIFFVDRLSVCFGNEMQLQCKLLIPVLQVYRNDCDSTDYLHERMTGERYRTRIDDSHLSAADRTNIEMSVAIKQTTDDLSKMQQYLRRLYYWFLLGPLITLEWLRRTKKLCSISGGQHVEGGRVPEETAVESGLNTAADHEGTQRNYNQETEHEQTGGETQRLLTLKDPYTNVTRNGHTRPIAIRRVINYLGEIFRKLAVGCGYAFLIVVALPVGISSGGWSFFRFDETDETQQPSFLDDLIKPDASHVNVPIFFAFRSFLPLWWSPLQVFCFFLYSRFACKTTWTVQNNFSKLIRSDWFASNMYLFISGVVVPYCTSVDSLFQFFYFTSYNMVCTICNVLFVIILNKHKFVTRYVLYISVCMICAYIESDIVALFYFMLNSKGSLTNLKLTALRTVAISLTLTLSFSTSMHIIRKLTKPRESLFEGLGEK